jgi:hypothetical protein
MRLRDKVLDAFNEFQQSTGMTVEYVAFVQRETLGKPVPTIVDIEVRTNMENL